MSTTTEVILVYQSYCKRTQWSNPPEHGSQGTELYIFPLQWQLWTALGKGGTDIFPLWYPRPDIHKGLR